MKNRPGAIDWGTFLVAFLIVVILSCILYPVYRGYQEKQLEAQKTAPTAVTAPQSP